MHLGLGQPKHWCTEMLNDECATRSWITQILMHLSPGQKSSLCNWVLNNQHTDALWLCTTKVQMQLGPEQPISWCTWILDNQDPEQQGPIHQRPLMHSGPGKLKSCFKWVLGNQDPNALESLIMKILIPLCLGYIFSFILSTVLCKHSTEHFPASLPHTSYILTPSSINVHQSELPSYWISFISFHYNHY